MAEGYKLWIDCTVCNAGKIKTWSGLSNDVLVYADCPRCGGSGFIFFGWCSADLFTLPTNLPDPE